MVMRSWRKARADMENRVESDISHVPPIPLPLSLLHCLFPYALHILCPRSLLILFPFRAQIKAIASIYIFSFLEMPKGRSLMCKLGRVRQEFRIFPNTQVDDYPLINPALEGCPSTAGGNMVACSPQHLQ